MKKHLTLMVIPHNESHVKEFHLSRPLLWGLLGSMSTFVVVFLFYAVNYYISQNAEAQIATLKTENQELKHQFVLIQERLDNFRHQVDELTNQDRMMRAWVDLSEPGSEVRQMGVGGGDESDPEWTDRVSADVSQTFVETYTSLDQLMREARFLEASFDTIVSKLNRNDLVRKHLPTISPVQGEWWRSSDFGYRQDPFTGRRQFHNGVDLAGWPGTPILATAAGTIEKVATDRRLGHYVKIDHGNGLQTIYGHLRSKPKLTVGAKVNRGEKIGEMGSTGRATATHVHYTIVKNGRAIQPLDYIFDDKSKQSVY